MNRTFRKLIAVLLTAIMVIGIVPAFALAEAVQSIENETETKTMPAGYIPGELHGARAVSSAYERGDMDTYYRLTGNMRDTLPSTYDSRNYNYVTSVKNQGSYGSCWAHAAMACVESYMIKFGIPVGTGSAATTSLNLSETQHCFFNYSTAYDAEGMLNGDKTVLTDSSAKNGLDCGGNGEMSAYTLMRWTGAASESVSALAYGKASTVASSGLNSQYAYGSNICHVQNSVWVPSTDIEGVKRAIMEYGAGNISYCAAPNNYTTYTYTYHCVTSTSASPNHAITVVGWDDTIAASMFSPNKPSKAGAWLCKNSWGASQFDQGYMYISYEDASVANSGYIYFYDAEPIDNYDHNYQYDGTCNLACYGKGYNSSTEWYEGFANNTQVANVFTAKGTEMLRAISFCSWDEALTYSVDVYKNPTAGNPSSGTRVSGASGYLTYAGYFTIELDSPVILNEGDTFSVVITHNCPTADDNGKYIHTPYDASFNNSSYADFLYWTHANHGSTSYYKEPNGSWTDCPDNGDYRIKAYTDDYEETFTVTAVSNNTAWGTVSVIGTIITAAPANGYYVESAEVISGTATVTVNGNTISVSPESDCTVRVNFAPKPSYTVSFIACGASVGSQTALVNDVITLPSTCSVTAEGWEFSGWVDTHVEETTNAPAYYTPGASYTVTGNATLYALYTRVEDSGGDTLYQKASQFEVGGRFAITAGNYAVKNTIYNTSNNHYVSSQSVTINDSTQTLTVAANVDVNSILYEVESGSVSGGFVLKNVANGKYLTLGSDEYLIVGDTPLAWLYDGADMNNQIDSEGYYYLSRSSNSTYFTTSKNTNGTIVLYQEISTAVTYYCTDPVIMHSHTMEHVAYKAPTCTEPGNTEYWHCTECGLYYSDANGENQIALEDTVLAPIGHVWGAPAYVWSDGNAACTATAICANDPTHVLTETVNAVYTVVTEPTVEAPGLGRYTATFENELFETQIVEVEIPKLEPQGYHINVHNYTSVAAATTSIDPDQLYSGEVTFTVDCGLVCVVFVDNGDGTYTRLVCTNADDAHSYTVTVTDADVDIVIVVRGDTNLNGKLETADSTLVKRAVAGLTPLSGDTAAIKLLAADVNFSGTLQTADSTLILRAVAGLAPFAW